MRQLVLVLAMSLTIAGCATDLRGTRLGLRTEPAGGSGGCDLAALAPVTIRQAGNDMVFLDGTGAEVTIIWPFGFAAWLEYGTAVLYASDGQVVGREGGVLDGIGGNPSDDGFHVCQIGIRTYR